MELPDINELQDLFHDTQGVLPLLDGFAAFTCDERGTGAFNFCDDLNEWKEFYPALLFVDALHFGYEIYDSGDFKLLTETYIKYSNCNWEDADFENFSDSRKELLLEYDILFAGPVKELFNTENEFASELIEDFGKNPNENVTEYLHFLKDYFRG